MTGTRRARSSVVPALPGSPRTCSIATPGPRTGCRGIAGAVRGTPSARRCTNCLLAATRKCSRARGGTCAICGRPDGEGRALSVDHDHGCCPEGDRTCGKCVRGLVCGACNHGLGKFRDSPELLRAAAAYLERHASQ
ncbi:endonuclease VII domain-containing protein [Streptomyces lavendulocolor]|uniref:endonuclease VII domain-containing protein n=1 Tax=Streptomyces lavendulocolor TaxID=67316 RepID=UPI0033F8EEFA